MALPLISVITVVYNSAAALEKTIQSVLNNSYPNLDFIIIDGNSSDGSADLIKSYSGKLKYWISEPDKGIYDAMNKGWRMASEDSFILFLGAGDCIITLPDMQLHAEDNIIFGNVKIADRYLFNTKVDFRMKLVNSAHHQALLIKKSIHSAPPFLLKFPVFADFDFNQRLYKAGFEFIKDKDFISYAMEAGTSSPHNRKEMLRVVEHNYGKAYVLMARAYYLVQSLKNKLTGFSAKQ